ncbi:aminotransferase class I/II-fold pyridoxal phosphate-dependent enzyme [Lipingzhangella sp. LS1_29]|uniref:Aminotransferase class I/II-fold pyridoxal phosphate-dependent enzyme n=1 Tax=Lipingzhangella rawalii TaxID=2055835 RepID=A0ABU2H9V0_9ACTN|nr:aminotransferase class I/II-fold pyridoxal phosphate-dependent enzyme [Lipingzhangella rawalii]MDS1271620.1 aminotransferase class I/II-fold pyridoxal phosphate-dependent enzyme [Lipingzhangella rawalii]
MVIELPHSVSGAAVFLDAIIQHLVPRLPRGARLLLDLAYADFMEAHSEIVAVGTLSKAHCLLGARVGYVLTATATAARLCQQRLPYALAALATAAASVSLADPPRVDQTIQANCTARARLGAELDERGIDYVPSQANFLLLNLAGWYQPVVDRLRARNARYRDGHRWELPGWIQLHVIDVPTVAPVIDAIADTIPGCP